ncbi:hypothetical protein SynRCC2555_01853 [Synechococcus sp. WH 8101]|nr:hypothetical protein SynRCC2555_01853 [Synechococcus sp. WH 8101]
MTASKNTLSCSSDIALSGGGVMTSIIAQLQPGVIMPLGLKDAEAIS